MAVVSTLKDKPHFKRLLSDLSKRTFFDIGQKTIKKIVSDSILASLTSAGQCAKVSNQKAQLTCLSHSIGKAIVEFVNDYGLDCSQEWIIKFLEETVQRCQKDTGGQGEDFLRSSLIFQVWDEESPEDKEFICIGIFVQGQSNQDFQSFGVKLTDAEMEEHHVKMVPIWRNNPNAYMHHAVFAKRSYIDPKDGELKLDTINSWGKRNPNPQIPFDEIYQMYYISFYQATVLQIESTGPSAEKQKSRYGFYLEAGFHNGAAFYRKIATIGKTKDQLFYKHVDNEWKIGHGPLDKGPSGLSNKSATVQPPLTGWNYFDGSTLVPDPEVKLTLGPDILGEALEVITLRIDADAATNPSARSFLNLIGQGKKAFTRIKLRKLICGTSSEEQELFER